MSRAASLSGKKHDAQTREAALDAARRAGLSLTEWLDETWRLHAADIRAHVDDLDDDERAYAVARRLAHRRSPGEGSRRSDRHAAEASGGRRAARDPDEMIWSRADRALDEMTTDRPREQSARERYEAAREERAWREENRTRPARRLSVDEAVDDIAERQSELEFGRARTHRATAEDARQPVLRRELSKLADSLADLQRGSADAASAKDFEALRADVAHIARGLSALAPRQSVEHIEAAVNDLARRIADARDGGLVQDFIAPVEALVGDLKRAVVGAAPTAALEAVERRLGALARNVEALAQTRVDPDSISNLLEHSQDIREMLAAAAASRPNVEALEKRIIDLGARIDRIAERGQTHAGLDAVVQSVAQIRAELELQNPIKAVKALDGRIDALARKIGEAASRSDVDAHFAQLGKRLDAMHRDLAERAPESRKLEAMMSALQARIEEARGVAGPAEMRDLVTQLMGRLDQAIGAGANPATIAALEDADRARGRAARLPDPRGRAWSAGRRSHAHRIHARRHRAPAGEPASAGRRRASAGNSAPSHRAFRSDASHRRDRRDAGGHRTAPRGRRDAARRARDGGTRHRASRVDGAGSGRADARAGHGAARHRGNQGDAGAPGGPHGDSPARRGRHVGHSRARRPDRRACGAHRYGERRGTGEPRAFACADP